MSSSSADKKSKNEVDVAVFLAHSQQGDSRADMQLREAFEKVPRLWEITGDLAAQAEGAWVNRAAGKSKIVQEAIWRQVNIMRTDLLGAEPSPLERLLVDRIVVCWLQMTYSDAQWGQSIGDVTIRQSDHQQRRLDSVHRRYVGAIKALAQVRRLLNPATLQVNIAGQQIVAAPGSTPATAPGLALPDLADGDATTAEDLISTMTQRERVPVSRRARF